MRRLPLQEKTVQDAIALWKLVRAKNFRAIFLQPTENTVLQLARYGITGGSTFLIDFCLLFILERSGVHYLPAAALSFSVGIACNFLLTKFFAFKSVDPTVGPAAEVAVFCGISLGGLVLTTALMYFFTGYCQIYFMLSKLLSALIVFIWNFLGRKLLLYPGKVKRRA